EVRDAFGYASGALVYRLRLPPRESATFGLVMPLFSGPALPADLQGMSPWEWLQREHDAAAAEWRAKLNRVAFHVPPAAQALIDGGLIPCRKTTATGSSSSWSRNSIVTRTIAPCSKPCGRMLKPRRATWKRYVSPSATPRIWRRSGVPSMACCRRQSVTRAM